MLEKFHFSVDPKNIGYQSLEAYKHSYMFRAEDFISRMRWKLYHIKQDLRKKRRNNECISEVDLNMLFNQHYDNNNSYGFRTIKLAPPDYLLKGFEQNIFGVVPMLKLQQYSNDIQKEI